MPVDPETGLMYPKCTETGSPTAEARYFTLEKKKRFINLADIMWPDLAAVCKEIGISRSTFNAHRAVDTVFCDILDDIKRAKVDGVEGSMFKWSARPQNFMDRIAILRAYKGETYNPQSTVTFRHEVSEQESNMRRAALATVVDGELSDASSQVLAADELAALEANPVSGLSEPAADPVQSPSGSGESISGATVAPAQAGDAALNQGEKSE